MKKSIITLGAIALIATGVNAQGLVAGWDFSGVAALDQTVNGYAPERTNFNNGISTSGSISTSLIQNTEVQFAANGAAAGQPGFNDGFDQTTSDLFGGGETGQQSLNFYTPASGSFDVTFNFTPTNDAVINFDWLTASTGFTSDILNVSYGIGGVFTAYEHPTNGSDAYWAGGSTAGWAQSTGNLGGLAPAFGSGQTDMVIDLDGLEAVDAIRFEFVNLASGERVGIDNVHIAGTAVPEPSAFAAIFGAIALGFAAIRRRR